MTTLNTTFGYVDGHLQADSVVIADIARAVDTPFYVYHLNGMLANLARLRAAFAPLKPHIHYSAKANANLAVLRVLVNDGVGIDAVSGGEIYKAIKAGAKPHQIVFAGVGKTAAEIQFALEQGVGWFNVENVAECDLIQRIADSIGRSHVQIALRLNPEVTANTHPHIATGHGGAKFGLTAEVIRAILDNRNKYPALAFKGIHVHIGSQLADTAATTKAVQHALELIAPYEDIRTVNIGGGLPTPYHPEQILPDVVSFARALEPLLSGYNVLLEPGRFLVASAGILVTQVLYIKRQAGQTYIITDASMSELIRPALYDAYHEIAPLLQAPPTQRAIVVGPVCETTDVLGRDALLPNVQHGDLLAILTTGAYGMVMASNYNARPTPPEVVIAQDGMTWHIARRRQTWEDLIAYEV